jgi:hypothetical protein
MKNFIDVIEAISRRPDMKLCDHPDERSGEHANICVFHTVEGKEEFLGKIVFVRPGTRIFEPYVEESVIKILESNNL